MIYVVLYAHHFSERLGGGEEDGLVDVVDAGGDDRQARAREYVRVVPLSRLIPLNVWSLL